MGPRRLLTERISAPFSGCRVDREAGTIAGVLLCGNASANGRDYPPDVFRRDFTKYEGRPVNADHAEQGTVDRRVGWFSGVTVDESGRPRGTLNLLKSHPYFERVMEAAERNPSLFGFSHVAMCRTRRQQGREVVESIERVHSIDLVADPATTNGFFEQVGDGSGNQDAQQRAMNAKYPKARDRDGDVIGYYRGKKKKRVKKRRRESVSPHEAGSMLTVEQLCEALVRHPDIGADQVAPLKALAEMDGMCDVSTDMTAAPADGADPAEGVTAAFKSAIMSIVEAAMSGDHDPKEALQKIKKLLASHGEVNGAGAETDSESDSDSEDDMAESKKPAADPWAILRECRAECGPDFVPGDGLLKALAALTDPADRKALLAEHKAAQKAAIEKPQSGRPKAQPGKVEESKIPTDPKAFADRYR